MNIVNICNSPIPFLTSDWTIQMSISILHQNLIGIGYLLTRMILNLTMNYISLQVMMPHMLMRSNQKRNQPTHPKCLTRILTCKLSSPGEWAYNYIMSRLSVMQFIDMGYQLKLKPIIQSLIKYPMTQKYSQPISRTCSLLPHAEIKYGHERVPNLVLKKANYL